MERLNNVWKFVEFVAEDVTLMRRLVPEVTDFEVEISTRCPVGTRLVEARPGDEFSVAAPGGDVWVLVVGIR